MVLATAASVGPLDFRRGLARPRTPPVCGGFVSKWRLLGGLTKTFDGWPSGMVSVRAAVEGMSENGRKVVMASADPGRCRGPIDAYGGGLISTLSWRFWRKPDGLNKRVAGCESRAGGWERDPDLRSPVSSVQASTLRNAAAGESELLRPFVVRLRPASPKPLDPAGLAMRTVGP